MLELSLKIEKLTPVWIYFQSELVKLTLYDRGKYELFQTKAFIEPELSNFNPALMNMSLGLEII